MTIEIQRPELEQFIRDEIEEGRFESVDELLTKALEALREKHAGAQPQPTKKNLARFLLESPFAKSDLDLERRQDHERRIEL